MGRGPGVRAASKTSLQVDFRYRGVRCRERIQLDPAKATSHNFVKQLKARIEHEIALGTFDYAHHFPTSPRARKLAHDPGSVTTWGELFTDWLRQVRPTLEPETYGDYAEYVARTWRPLLGSRPVSTPIRGLVNEWMAAKDASKKRILNVLTPLRQACRYATSQVPPLLKVDPLAELEVRRPNRPVEDIIDPFTPQELTAAVDQLPTEMRNLVHFWAWTGLRQGELFALKWSDVDLERKTARIARSSRAGRLKATKTATGVRTVRLLPPALEALQRQRALTALKHREIFLRPATDEPWGADKPFRVIWKAALLAAGVRYRFPRQLRHTFASWMLGANENPLWVSRHMGHTNPAFTLKVYARLIPDMFPEAGMRAVREISKTA